MSKRLALSTLKGTSGPNKRLRFLPSWFEEMKKEIWRLPKDVVQIVMNNYLRLVILDLKPGSYVDRERWLLLQAIPVSLRMDHYGVRLSLITYTKYTKEEESKFFNDHPTTLLPESYPVDPMRELYFGDYRGIDLKTNLYSDKHNKLKNEDIFNFQVTSRLWQFQDGNERKKRMDMRPRTSCVSKGGGPKYEKANVHYNSLPVMLNPWMFFLYSYKSLMDPSKVRREVGMVKNMFKDF